MKIKQIILDKIEGLMKPIEDIAKKRALVDDEQWQYDAFEKCYNMIRATEEPEESKPPVVTPAVKKKVGRPPGKKAGKRGGKK